MIKNFIINSNSQNLRNHLRNKNNHIHLIFPYLDYNINFKHEEKNNLNKFETIVNMKDIELSVGMIIPNYNINNKAIRLRQLMKEEQEKTEMPLFFVITKKSKESQIKLNEIKLFENQIGLEFFNYHLLYNIEDNNSDRDKLDYNTRSESNKESYVEISELKSLDVIVIRPDFIIEYIYS